MSKTLHDTFIKALYKKFPKKARLTQEIMDLLHLEREAVYRRLRKDVFFTAHEVVKIASVWNISLDEMIGISSEKVPFQMHPIDYINPSKRDVKYLQGKVTLLNHFPTSKDTEYMEVCNRVPRPLSIGFLPLYRFKIFNWAYQYTENENYKLFSKIVLPNDVYREFERYNKLIRNVTTTSFILDPKIFDHYVNTIKYYHSILLITDEEKELLKNEIYALLNYMKEIADIGCYPETQKKVNLYISQLNIDTYYSYFYGEQLKICRIHAFGKFDIGSQDLEMVDNFRTWMNLKKRTAIQISEVNEKSRIEYFTRQRQLVDSL
jgi:hypothetical protein